MGNVFYLHSYYWSLHVTAEFDENCLWFLSFFPLLSFPSSNTQSVMQTNSFFSATRADVGPFQWIFTVDPSGYLDICRLINPQHVRKSDWSSNTAFSNLFAVLPHVMNRTSHIYTIYISLRVKCVSPCSARLLLALGFQVIALTLCGNMLIKLD